MAGSSPNARSPCSSEKSVQRKRMKSNVYGRWGCRASCVRCQALMWVKNSRRNSETCSRILASSGGEEPFRERRFKSATSLSSCSSSRRRWRFSISGPFLAHDFDRADAGHFLQPVYQALVDANSLVGCQGSHRPVRVEYIKSDGARPRRTCKYRLDLIKGHLVHGAQVDAHAHAGGSFRRAGYSVKRLGFLNGYTRSRVLHIDPP